jgi:hypothetical protein
MNPISILKNFFNGILCSGTGIRCRKTFNLPVYVAVLTGILCSDTGIRCRKASTKKQ